MPFPKVRISQAVRSFLTPFKVEDADGGFFESFTALSWKQENRRLQKAREEERYADEEQRPPAEATAGIKVNHYKLPPDQVEALYTHALYTILHRVPSDEAPEDEERQLVEFARDVFNASADTHERCWEAAIKAKPPTHVLNVTVLEAQGLEAKDPNGFSDPYCMLGIQPGTSSASSSIAETEGGEADAEERGESRPKRGHGFRLSFKKRERSDSRSRDREELPVAPSAIPAKVVCATSVQPATLNPVWNEKFRYDVDDFASDKFHLDIWDHDDESSVLEAVKKLNEIQTWKGLGRYFKQIAQSARTSGGDNVDDFLGSVTIPIHSIPAAGIKGWFELQGRSQRSTVQGKIHLQITWSGREELSRDTMHAFLLHEQLFSKLIEHETSQRGENEMYYWDGTFSSRGSSLLQHHIILGDLTELQIAMCEWIALSRKLMEVGLDYDLLHRHLVKLNEVWVADNLQQHEEELLAESFTLFVDFCLNLLRKQRDLFPCTNTSARGKLHALLRCLSLLQSMQAFWRCCPFHKEIHAEVNSVIKKGTLEWYERMHALTRPQVNDEESLVQSFIELANIVNEDLYKAIKYYDNIFASTIGLSYFTLIYKQLDRLTNDDVGAAVQELCEAFRQMDVITKDMNDQHVNMGTSLFELYLALQEFASLKSNLPQSDQQLLTVIKYHQWFTDAVTRWLHIARYKAMLRIRKAIEIEKTVVQIDSLVKHSTSAVDTTSCFYQIKTFWKQLAWPDMTGSYVFIAKILDDICYGAVFFADLTYRKLCDAGFYDEEGQFDVTEQLCVTINNIEHVRDSLQRLPGELGVEAMLRAIEQSQGETSSSTCRRAIDQVMHSALDDVENQILKVVEHVGEKMRADLRKYAFHLTWAPDALPTDEAIVPLMEYLDSNLTTLNSNLLAINFTRVLWALWAVVLEELRVQAESGVGEKQIAFFERLHNGVQYLKDYFHAEGKGLAREQLENELYQSFQRLLDLHRLATEELVSLYYDERLRVQMKVNENGPRDFGVLTVRVYFHHDSLSVEVLSARDILALDTNGYSDPFVIIELLPQSVFSNCPAQRTRVQKKTLTPIFEEIFEYPATLDQCHLAEAMIQFTVMDHDVVLSNDFAGEAFLSLNGIPGVADDEFASLHGLKPTDLPLLRPRRNENEILNALEKRPWDRRAQEFARGRKAHSA
uniref:BAI1-associated protein 3 n=1 Tax=Hemiscolopendra marginata TaxID=943146 RepID=A0A646QF95_9MYRI